MRWICRRCGPAREERIFQSGVAVIQSDVKENPLWGEALSSARVFANFFANEKSLTWGYRGGRPPKRMNQDE